MSSEQPTLPGQPAIAIVTGLCAILAVTGAWFVAFTHNTDRLDERSSLLLLCMFAALILAYHFPIHVDLSSKVYMGSVVLYLMACLLPPAVAATAAGVGVLAGELSISQRTGNYKVRSIIPTQVARWCIVALAGSVVAHISFTQTAVPLVAAGMVMWSADILTGPLLLSPMLRQNPIKVVRLMVREGGVFEAVQYLVGLMGSLQGLAQAWTLLLLFPPAALVYLAFNRSTQIRKETRRMFEDLADTTDQRDLYGGHSGRVADMTRETLQRLGARGMQLDLIVLAARAHDIGLMAIPDDILRKPGNLTAAERAVMETHSEKGADLFARYSDLTLGARIIRHHHEAWDGSGYPHRLKGTDIPLGSRVIAVVESYDAMTHDRPYRRRMTANHAATILRAGRGTQWDPDVVDAFLNTIKGQSMTAPTVSLRLLRDEADGEAR